MQVERIINQGQARGKAAAVSQRENLSATQWLFNPFSLADTTNWAVTTGLGKLAIGTFTRVVNTTHKVNRGSALKSTFELLEQRSTAYREVERFAVTIANEVSNAFPNRVFKMKTLAGKEDIEDIVSKLLGDTMEVRTTDSSPEIVPVLPVMLNTLRANIRQHPELANIGREIEQAILTSIAVATEDLKIPQQEVAQGKRAGFDTNAKRNFLALGKEVPDTLKFTTGNQQADTLNVMEKLSKGIDKFTDILGGAQTQEAPQETPQFADEAVTSTKCTAITSKGNPCSKDAVKDGKCGSHK